MEKLKIMIDNREGKRIQPCKDFFKKSNEYDTEVKQLPHGDYVCGNCAIEYKSTNDLIHSIQSKRVFKQAVGLTQNYQHHFIFMESEKVKLQNAIKKSQFVGHPFSWKQYYGAISSLAQITCPLVVPNFKQACEMMSYLFKKCNDNKTRHVFATPKRYDNFLVNSLASIDGIAGNTALLIIDSLELKGFRDLGQVTHEDLVSVKGIGIKTANLIMEAIDGT